MAKKTTREELEQRVKALEKEAAQNKQLYKDLLENEKDKYHKLMHSWAFALSRKRPRQ